MIYFQFFFQNFQFFHFYQFLFFHVGEEANPNPKLVSIFSEGLTTSPNLNLPLPPNRCRRQHWYSCMGEKKLQSKSCATPSNPPKQRKPEATNLTRRGIAKCVKAILPSSASKRICFFVIAVLLDQLTLWAQAHLICKATISCRSPSHPSQK